MSEPESPPQPLFVSLVALTVVSGFVDAVSYLGLGHVFTANMTGNLVLIGFAAVGGSGLSLSSTLTALGVFLVGAVAGGRIAGRVRPHRMLLLVAMVIEVVFVAVATAVAAATSTIASGWPHFTVIALLAFTMGIRNTAVQRIGVPGMTTTVVTTTLAGLASDSTLAGGANPHAANRAASVLGMFGGALVGATLVLHVAPAWALGVACGITACTAAFFYREAPLELSAA
jgi:uncharacterized membrane protein YoaK (UPF0700 family)